MPLLPSLAHNLRNLHRFSGCDPAPVFWPYAIGVVMAAYAAIAAAMLPWLLENLERMQRFAAEHPDRAEVKIGPGHYSITIEAPSPP